MKLRLVTPPLLLLLACAAESDGDTQANMMSATAPDTSAGSGDAVLGCAVPEEQDSTDGMSNPLMETWGAACSTDAECVALIGDGGVCLLEAVVYELPYGYCTKPCALPDMSTRSVVDDPACDPAGGVACVGQQGAFEYCSPLCTDDAQCNRDGYICRQMPIISMMGDPSLCLMPDCCQDTCDPND